MNLYFDPNTGALAGRPGLRYLELGGGAFPMVRPNADVRPCAAPDGAPTVDIVIDFEKPFTRSAGQALSTCEFDGVFSKFALEHVSWRRTLPLLKEIKRVLKPGGDLVLVLPDTEAQARHLLATNDWADAGSMLFGGQDYGENAHKAFFSADWVLHLLHEAGFTGVTIAPFGAKKTDMVVHAVRPAGDDVVLPADECPGPPDAAADRVRALTGLSPAAARRVAVPKAACAEYPAGHYLIRHADVRKELEAQAREAERDARESKELILRLTAAEKASPGPGEAPKPVISEEVKAKVRAERAAMFDRRYFDGGSPYGGYQGYRDYGCHELTARHALAKLPDSVIEIGAGRGYVARRIESAGVSTWSTDVSRHCFLTRCRYRHFLSDATEPPVWEAVTGYAGVIDLCLSVALLDHVPEALLPDLFGLMVRHTRRGLHGVNPRPGDGDRTRCTVRPLSWWRDVMPAGHEVVDKNELEDGTLPQSYLEGDGKVKLNVGSYTTAFHHGWTNCDVLDLSGWMTANHYKFLQLDMRRTLPFATESVDLIVCQHALEHVSYGEGREFLRECRRVLKPSGAMRLCVPDTAGLISAYASGMIDRFDELSATAAQTPDNARKLYEILVAGHQATYDLPALLGAFREAGFEAGEGMAFAQTCWGNKDAFAQIRRETYDVLPDLSLYVDAVPA